MSTLTLTELMTIMRECAGEGDYVGLTGDILDVEFTSLGYDSLALLETAGRIEQKYGVRLADDQVTEAKTPRQFLDMASDAIAMGPLTSAGGQAD